MTLSVGMVTIDCADPRALAAFWTEALGLEVSQDFFGEYLVLSSDASPVAIGIQRVPEPRAGKNRLHLDLTTEDSDGEVARLVALGAKEVGKHEVPGFGWTVLTDPEGNEFCVGAAHA
ncbi:VOC family protein [Amycolatopsis xylanica]|nr:VOC family protein [Amycolatopsis xylanica]